MIERCVCMVAVVGSCIWVFAPFAWAADVLPPDLVVLQGHIQAAVKASAKVEAELAQQRAREKTLDASVRGLVQAALAMDRVPPAYWTLQAMLQNQPDTPGLMRAFARANGRAMARAQVKGRRLAALYAQTLAQRQELEDLNRLFIQSRGRLRAEERGMLQQAGVEADVLAKTLEDGLAGQVEMVVRAPDPLPRAQSLARWPVVGRVAQGFKGGKGATAEGVVLQGAPFGVVKSPVAGTVLYAGPFRVFGGLVIVKALSGEDVLLGGFSALGVNPNTPVQAGQVLGKLSEHGRLYWEVRQNTRVLNPLRFAVAGPR